MASTCGYCDRRIGAPESETTCLGDHPDRDRQPMLLHIACPCPVHGWVTDRAYNVPERSGGDDDSDSPTVEELLEELPDDPSEE